MKRRLLFTILIGVLVLLLGEVVSVDAYSNKRYLATCLRGGTTGCLDKINGSILSAGDFSHTNDGTRAYFHTLKESGCGAVESDANIFPDSNPGTKCWEEVSATDMPVTVGTDGQVIISDGSAASWISISGAITIDNAGVVSITNDSVKDVAIDWGTGSEQVSAVDVPIADAGGLITGTEVETALQENRGAIDTNTGLAHAESHTVVSHSDTTATGAELDTLTDTSDASGLHNHTTANLNDTTATGAHLNTLTDDSMADALHRHSELSASDGTPDQVVAVDADGNTSMSGGLAVDGEIDYNSDATRIFVVEGDSLSEAIADTWVVPLQESNSPVAGYTFTNYAVSGATLCQMDSQYATEGALSAPSKDAESAYFFVWGGTNNLNRPNNVAEVYACAVSLWASARADNYKVGAFTVTPRGDDPYDGESTTPIVIDDCVGTNFGVTAHNMVKDQRIQASVGSECNLTEGETYYVLSVVGVDDITISETVDGSAISGDSDASITTSLGKLTYEEFRVQLNRLILSDKTLYDYLIRPDILFSDATNVTYYSDLIHLTTAANDLLAEHISNVLIEPIIKTMAHVTDDRTLTGFNVTLSFGGIDYESGYASDNLDRLIIESATASRINLVSPSGSGLSGLIFSNESTHDVAGYRYNQNSGDMHLETNSTKRMVIDFGGNIGIGAVNNPDSSIHIDQGAGFGSIKADGSSGGCLMIRDTDDGGWSKGKLLNGVITWSIDADGICD